MEDHIVREENKKNRDKDFKIAALTCAINRASQDGGIQNDRIDVFSYADMYYDYLTGKTK